MNAFGYSTNRKQKQSDIKLPAEYLLLASEPPELAYSFRAHQPLSNRYLAIRQLRTHLQRKRHDTLN